MTTSVKNGRIETTEQKAQEVTGIVEKMITMGKQGDLHSRHLAASYLLDETVVQELFNTMPQYADRKGGYTRIADGPAAEMHPWRWQNWFSCSRFATA